MVNPYTLRPVTSDEFFDRDRGGRGTLAYRLLQNLRRQKPLPDSISVIGERRFGKTSLLGHLQRSLAATPDVVTCAIDMLNLEPRDPTGFYAMLGEELSAASALPEGRGLRGLGDLRKALFELHRAGRRLILLIDEFDVVAGERRFERRFFDSLRSLANRSDLPLVLVVASVAPLPELVHAGAYGSPFFNIFRSERLKLLSLEEADALVRHPPGGERGFGRASAAILRLAGRHPYLLQLACSCAWELREESQGKLDAGRLPDAFGRAARDQHRYIWDHSSAEERRALCDLIHGTRTAGQGLTTLAERGYITEDDGLRLCGDSLAHFVQEQCAASPPVRPTCEVTEARPTSIPAVSPTVAGCASPPRFALVVGVNCYRYPRSGNFFLPELRYATQDAIDVAALLRGLDFEVTELTDTAATYDAVQEAFARLHGMTMAQHPGSCFVFHFSGHGLLAPHDAETAYLMVHDSDPAAPARRGVEMRRLVYELMPLVRVAHSVVTLDACHSGFAAGMKDIVPVCRFPNLTGQLFAALRGRMVLAACAGHAQARESEGFAHGVFTHYLLRHWRDLEGEHPHGRITFGSLVDYVARVMAENHPELPLPVYNGMGEGGMLVLRTIPPERLDKSHNSPPFLPEPPHGTL